MKKVCGELPGVRGAGDFPGQTQPLTKGMVWCLLQTQPLTTALLAINTVPSASGCGQLVKVVKNASKKMNKKYFDVCDSEGCNRLAIVFIS